MQLGRLRFGLLRPVVGAICVTGIALLGNRVNRRGPRRRTAADQVERQQPRLLETPPADWFIGDETAQQHGTHPYPGQPLPTPHDELVGLVKDNIKLLPGFHSKSWPISSTAPPDGVRPRQHARRSVAGPAT